jgi:hypothetical protein
VLLLAWLIVGELQAGNRPADPFTAELDGVLDGA